MKKIIQLMLLLLLACTSIFAQTHPLDEDDLSTQLFSAIDNNNVKELSSLISTGLDLNKLRRPKGKKARTLLQYAAKYGKLEIAKLLIDKGADLEVKSATRKTAYDYAVQYEKESIIKLLQQAGAKDAIPINKSKIIEDLEQFRSLLHSQSSYLYSHRLDPDSEIDQLISSIKEPVNIQYVYYEMVKILGKIGDRHSKIKWKKLKRNKLGLPFALAPLNGKAVAVIPNEQDTYDLFLKKYPYLKTIDGIPLDEFINRTSWRHRYAPKLAKFHRGLKDINETLQSPFYYLQKGKHKNTFEFTFTDGETEKNMKIQLSGINKIRWKEQSFQPSFDNMKIIGKNVGYISIPEMTSTPSVLNLIAEKMITFKNTNAIILDVRDNGGGSRDILMCLAPYFISPQAPPWVANVAKIRNNQSLSEDISSMRGRYLYNYDSDLVTDDDREAIDKFMKDFTTQWSYDFKRFSDDFYMIIRHDKGKNHYYYDKPVYILANEQSFSAASVFTSAMKGMGKVKVAGICTDGSSGRSMRFDLKHSKINVKISTMISFQRNGKTLDTNGTEPDIMIHRDMKQVLGKRDTQLEKLLEYIERQ